MEFLLGGGTDLLYLCDKGYWPAMEKVGMGNRAREIKEMAHKAVKDGGSSASNCKLFIQEIAGLVPNWKNKLIMFSYPICIPLICINWWSFRAFKKLWRINIAIET